MLFCHIASRTSAVVALVCASSVMTGLKACTTYAQTSAQASPPPMTLVQLAELPRLVEPQLSPNGRAVTYMLATADWTLNRLTYHLWRQDIGGGAPVALTSGTPGETPFSTRWSPDASSILFARSGQLMVLPAAGGTARAVTKHATGVTAPTWSPDGSTIYFTATDAPTAADRERDRRRDDL